MISRELYSDLVGGIGHAIIGCDDDALLAAVQRAWRDSDSSVDRLAVFYGVVRFGALTVRHFSGVPDGMFTPIMATLDGAGVHLVDAQEVPRPLRFASQFIASAANEDVSTAAALWSQVLELSPDDQATFLVTVARAVAGMVQPNLCRSRPCGGHHG